MNKTEKRQSDLRNKLIAAVAMLLVSCIMMVSTTYAWFTLSTAPEVQGITTTVGANGNLEIALSPYSGDAADITSAMGDANLTWDKKNLTWGNLLNLSDNSVYGLEDIALLPARLNANTGDGSSLVVNSGSPLLTPSYGADGRPQALNANTTVGSKVNSSTDTTTGETVYTQAVDFMANTYKGIRAIGTSATMSEYEVTFNAALSDLAAAVSTAKSNAQNSLNNNGGDLTGLAIKHGLAGDTDDNDYQDNVPGLVSVVDYLDKANAALVDAIKAAVLAEAASSSSSEDKYTAAVAAITDNATIAEVQAYMTNYPIADAAIKANVEAAAAKYATISSELAKSKTALSGLYTTDADGTVKAVGATTWEQISAVLTPLMNTSKLVINGLVMSDFMDLGEKGIGNNILQNGLNITMETGSGVYADFGSVVGNLEASVEVPKFDYNGTTLGGWPAYMETDSEVVAGGYLPAARTGIAGKGVLTVTGVTGDSVINVPYAYMVDFMFRTNAAGSSLKLQTTPAQRVYEESTSSATQGSGSTMSFTVDSTVLSGSATLNLMKSIRVVFMDTNNYTIYGIAKIDTEKYETYAAADLDLLPKLEGDLYLHKYTLEDGILTIGSKIAEDAALLCELPQNTAIGVSALVYLDGDNVTNADVANGVTSMMGAMNLQFASTADLVPMENTALENMTGEGEYKATVNVNNGLVTETSTVTAGAPFTYTVPAHVLDSYTINNVTVTMGGEEVANAWDSTNNKISIDEVTGEIVVTVTATAKTSAESTTATETTTVTP